MVLLSGITFDGNGLSGTIPPDLFEIKALRDMWLNDNALSGRSLPDNIGSATALTALAMVTIVKLGCIPTGLSTLKRLEDLSLVRKHCVSTFWAYGLQPWSLKREVTLFGCRLS